MDRLVFKVRLVFKAFKEILDRLVFRVFKACKETKVTKVIKVILGFKEPLELVSKVKLV